MFYCSSCEKNIKDVEIIITIEDETFDAPYGDDMRATGGGKVEVKTCPNCGEEVEE